MVVEMLAAESLGVRSMATRVVTGGRRILIDPGESVAPRRYRLPPHPRELVASRRARRAILAAAATADTIVLTHYHHDHFTPEEERPTEFSTPEAARTLYAGKVILAKAWDRDINRSQRLRAERFLESTGRDARPADGRTWGPLAFSPAVPHGEAGSRQGWVVMVRVDGDDGRTFVHASDIQLLHPPAIDLLLGWRPDLVFASGPALYLPALAPAARATARAEAQRLARAVRCLVLDHHFLRDPPALERLDALDRLARRHGNRVLTAARFMGRPDRLLEAHRDALWGDRAPARVLPATPPEGRHRPARRPGSPGKARGARSRRRR